MAKTSIRDLPIYTWSPNQEGLPCLAYIGRPGQIPMHFTGKTPMQAHMTAEKWRNEELAKIDAREAAKEKRLAGRRAARAAENTEADS